MFAKKLVVFLVLLGACERSSANRQPEATLHTKDGASVAVALELATTEIARERGLMFRKELGANAGMLFIFPNEAQRTFWMKNTYIPLDMIFINAQRTVVGVVERAEPITMTPRGVAAPSKYVIEVNGGFAAAHGIGAGTQVDLRDVAP